MKGRAFFSILAAIAISLVAAGAAGAVWIATHSPLGLLDGVANAQPEAAVMIPKQAPAMVSLLVNPDRVEALRQAIAPLGRRRAARHEWQQARDAWLTRSGLTYDRDVQPWLGDEVTLAVTTVDIDRDPNNGREPGYLLAAAANDPDRAREFLQLFWQKQALNGINLIFEQYKGVKIVHGEALDLIPRGWAKRLAQGGRVSTQTDLATALVADRFVLAANDPKVLRDAINNIQAADLSLLREPDYQRELAALPPDRLAIAYVNPTALGELLEPATATRRRSKALLPAEWLAALPAHSATLSLKAERSGLVTEAAWVAADGLALVAAESPLTEPATATRYLPSTATIALSGTNLQQLTEQWQQILGDGPIAQAIAPLLSQVETTSGLNLQNDLLAWNTEDFALGLIPVEVGDRAAERALGEFPGDWVFVAHRNPKTTAALDRIDALAKQQGLTLGTLNLDSDQLATVWTQLIAPSSAGLMGWRNAGQVSTQVQGARATVGDYEILATSVPALAAAVQAGRDETASLLGDHLWQSVVTTLPVPNDGNVTLSWPAARPVVRRLIPLFRLVEVPLRPLFDRLDRLSFTSEGGPENLRRFSLFAHWTSW
ncbi:DUF3352 domain-containing protein [Limnothrix redekei]|uniref:DUF3352 domain-containing protein n=1 Tax=Limnothrix redekei LRLZ20PSL1 TaxID=3112953 RepID=A0ABW7C7I3_9CYAN